MPDPRDTEALEPLELADCAPEPRRCRMVESGLRVAPFRNPARSVAVYTKLVYTKAVLDGVRGFDWDRRNAGHVARHGVGPEEVEEAFERPHAIVPARDAAGEKRWKLLGASKDAAKRSANSNGR
jgi:hypothetical protein